MKPSAIFLSLTLLANLILAAVVILKPAAFSSASGSDSTRAASSDARSTTTSLKQTAASESFTAQGRSLPASSQNIWSQLYSEDLDRFVSHLRSAGFSFREIRAIISPLAQKRFETMRAEIVGKQEDRPYWRTPDFYFSMPEDPAQRAKLTELMQEESKVYMKHFSRPEAIAEDEEMQQSARRQFGNLPVEKLQQLSKIQFDYQELQSELYMNAQKRPRSELNADERNQLKLLEAELQRDLQQTLTPEEYTEYLYRSSPTANSLRSKLDLFRPTEAEYKALFTLLRPVDEQFSTTEADTKTLESREAALKKLDPQIQAALGPERYADYKQISESGSDQVTRLMARLDLPLSTVGKINVVRDDINKRAKAVRTDKQLTPAERDIQLAALAQEAQTKLTTTLGGTRGYEAYSDVKGDWLRVLQPKPATP
ncbi:MAG: hypothetical protein QM760_16610 [Nibricoccus sp.]